MSIFSVVSARWGISKYNKKKKTCSFRRNGACAYSEELNPSKLCQYDKCPNTTAWYAAFLKQGKVIRHE